MRIVLTALSLLLALPQIITFNNLLLWKLTLAISEYGHRIAIIPAMLLVWNLRRKAWIGAVMAMLALFLMLWPLVMAWSMPLESGGASLNWSDLWFGKAPSVMTPSTITLPAHGDVQERQMLFYPSQAVDESPCIIIIHGGSWQNGSPAEFGEWSQHWANQGYAVVSLEYRLAPKWQWPAPQEDVRDALSHLKEHAKQYSIDPTRFVLLGRSAGGQIATAAACNLRDPAIRGCISLYAPADMVFARRFGAADDILDTPKLLGQYLGGAPEQVPVNYLSSSATLLADASTPPMLLIHGRRDVLVWHLQSRRLAAQLKKAGVPHFFLDLPWATHALDYPFHGPGAQLTRHAVDRFLKQTPR